MTNNKKVLQLFEGYIEDVNVDDSTFTSVLFDLTEPDNLNEFAEFDFKVVEIDDQHLIQQGHIFQWEIGEIVHADQELPETYSRFKFLTYTRKEIAKIRKNLVKAKKKANRMYVQFI